MVALSRPPYSIRLSYLTVIFFLVFCWYLLLHRSKTPVLSIESAFPLFQSRSNIDIRQPEDTKSWPYRVFRTSTHRPPHMTVSGNGKPLSDGYYFITPQNGPKGEGIDNPGGYVMRNDSELVYATSNMTNSRNLRVQTMGNHRYMTSWTGTEHTGHGYGDVVIIDEKYTKRTISLQAIIKNHYPGSQLNGSIDFHEQQVTARGTILVTAFNTTGADLSSIGGKADGYILDSLFFEIDIETEHVVFAWSALELFRISESRLPLDMDKNMGSWSNPYDFFHINSVQAIGSDAYLVSSRNLWSINLISRLTGNVIWELGGGAKGGNFAPLPPYGRFRWQSHVRAYNATSTGMLISMFDNHYHQDKPAIIPSRGMLYHVKAPTHPAEQPTVLRIVTSDKPQFSSDGGSYQPGLSNENQLISYGQVPLIHEFGPGNGSDLRWEARFGYDDMTQSYRVFKAKWEGTPKAWAPILLIEKPEESLRGYVSWNGATDIESWRLYSVERDSMMRPLGKILTQGFETEFDVPDEYNSTECIMAVALKKGKEIRQSNTACLEGVTFKAEPLTLNLDGERAGLIFD